MTCDHVNENLHAFADNELDATLFASISQHLENCKNCQQKFAAINTAKDLSQSLLAPALSESFDIKLKLAIEKKQRGSVEEHQFVRSAVNDEQQPDRKKNYRKYLTLAASLAFLLPVLIFTSTNTSINTPINTADSMVDISQLGKDVMTNAEFLKYTSTESFVNAPTCELSNPSEACLDAYFIGDS